MSINATSNYMSNADILAWMETKTDSMYGQMTSAMQASDRNADAEAALNKVKEDIANAQNAPDRECAAIHDDVNDALAKYGDIPGVKDALQPIADILNGCYGTADPVNCADPASTKSVPLFKGHADAWPKTIDGTLADLGKKDQLALINIQEFNSQINQAKQTASALMEAADKSANAIINHIA
jgi:F0F1-type ATP synthase membrane subunit b/b'